MSQDPILKREEAAQYMGLKPQTLAAWKCRHQDGPDYIKIGRSVRYRQSALDAWLERNKVRAEALRPDKAKLWDVYETLNAVAVPEVSDAAKETAEQIGRVVGRAAIEVMKLIETLE